MSAKGIAQKHQTKITPPPCPRPIAQRFIRDEFWRIPPHCCGDGWLMPNMWPPGSDRRLRSDLNWYAVDTEHQGLFWPVLRIDDEYDTIIIGGPGFEMLPEGEVGYVYELEPKPVKEEV